MDSEVTGQDAASRTDMMKILVATDNHIGYMEKDPVRFNDSLESFEEVLKIAKSSDVDFILLGGDLYHDNKPSRQTLYRSMELFRHYCMGDRPCPIEYCSNPTTNFHHSKFQGVNYEDPNFNISIPVFSIHGNHDDPVGEGNLSAIDILHVSNLINYFGKVDNIEKIEVSPVLLRKGCTKLALYGLGSCRDERLHRMFRKGNVKFLRPSEDKSDWFNVLVLHQNRAKHGATNYIPPSFLPDFFDLVIWGHEHECRIEPEFVPTGGESEDGEEKGLYISQPGSSVATSFGDGEQKPKHCGILYIKDDCTFKMEPVKLKTVRPFLLESLCLADTGIHPQDNEKVESYLTGKTMQLIERAKRDGENDKLPLVRLKVDYHGGYSTFSLARFGQKFLDKAANPKNLLAWHCRRDNQATKKNYSDGSGIRNRTAEDRAVSGAHISEYLEEEVSKEKIQLLSDKSMTEALFEFVEKMENDSISACVKYSLQVSQNLLKSKRVLEGDISTHMEKERAEFFRVQETEAMSAVREELATNRETLPDPPLQDTSSEEDQAEVPVEKPSKGRGRGRGSTRGAGGRGAARGRSGRGASTKSQASQGGRKKSGNGACGTSHRSLQFSPGPSTATSGRGASKRSLNYLDSGSEDDVFQSRAKINKVCESDMIDLTQNYDEVMALSSRTQASLKPIRGSKRTKK